jgi:hypothetical protein
MEHSRSLSLLQQSARSHTTRAKREVVTEMLGHATY